MHLNLFMKYCTKKTTEINYTQRKVPIHSSGEGIHVLMSEWLQNSDRDKSHGHICVCMLPR